MNTDHISRRGALTRAGLMAGLALVAPGRLIAAGEAPKNGSFRFCLNTGTIRGQKLGIVKEIEIASKAGYQGIEPWVESIDQYVKGGGSLKDLKARLSDGGLTMESAIGFAEWIVDEDARREKGLERARREMDMISQLGALRTAAPPAGATQQAGLDLMKAAERYQALLKLGDQFGIVPMLEIWGFSKNISRVGEAACVAIEANHPKACILPDIFHLYKGGSDPASLRMVRPEMIPVFHMNDYPADPPRDKVNDSFRVMPGDGIAPVAVMLNAIRCASRPTVLSLELFNKKYYEMDALEVARLGLAKMKAAVEKAGQTQ